MAENSIPSVGAIAPIGDSEAGRVSRTAVDTPPVRFDAALSQAEARPDAKLENRPESKTKDQTPEAAKQAAANANSVLQSNVRLHFRVDPKTHEVTVLMVDQASKRVVRSIPPEEIGKLKEGDLVELFA
jgi:uncharacterized FlaG/YvyC family protein